MAQVLCRRLIGAKVGSTVVRHLSGEMFLDVEEHLRQVQGIPLFAYTAPSASTTCFTLVTALRIPLKCRIPI